MNMIRIGLLVAWAGYAASATFAGPSKDWPGPHWPKAVALKVGEQATYKLRDGGERTFKLVSYEPGLYRTTAIVEVGGHGRTERASIHVGFDAVPVAINGVRVYGYTWKEIFQLENGFEQVDYQGKPPLMEAGKDVGFALSDARYSMYPDMDQFTYPLENAFFEAFRLGPFLAIRHKQAHAGYDVGIFGNVRVLAMMDGYVDANFWGSGNARQGQVFISSTRNPYNSPGWHFSHIKRLLVEKGQYVKKGTPLATRPNGPGYHMGSWNTFDFGPVHFAAEVWRHEHRDDWPCPRYWLVLTPYQGDMKDAHIHSHEGGDLPVAFLPRKGDTDKDGRLRWKFHDNFANAVVRMTEASHGYPFGIYHGAGNPNKRPYGSVGYSAVYVYSTADHTRDKAVHMKWGLSNAGKIWLNGKTLWKGTEDRYPTYNPSRESPLVIDKYDLPLPLAAGWNTLIFKTNLGTRKGTEWLYTAKIGDEKGMRRSDLIFSTRDINAKVAKVDANSVELSWQHPDFHGSFIDTYRLDVAADPAFADLVKKDLDMGRQTSYTVSDLPGGTPLYFRIKPFNVADMGGSVYWQHADVVTATTSGTRVAATRKRTAPASGPRAGLSRRETPAARSDLSATSLEALRQAAPSR